VPDTYAITQIGTPGGLQDFLYRLDLALGRGLKLIQFREPDWPGGPAADTLHQALHEVLVRAHATGARVLVNSAHPRSWWDEADGVHLRAVDLTGERPQLAPSALLGASVHDTAELGQARRMEADFAVLSSVLPTASHPGQVTLGWPLFQELAAEAGLPVFALGGMSPAMRGEAIAHGAHGIAGIRAFW
jgi:8-oxo-dGTP diphosphatase